MEYIYTQVNEELKISSDREAAIIREKLLSIESLTAVYRNETERVLSEEHTIDRSEKDNLAVSKDGVLYSKQDLGAPPLSTLALPRRKIGRRCINLLTLILLWNKSKITAI